MFLLFCIPLSGCALPQHTCSSLSDQEVTSVVSCSLCRGAGHEIKLLLVISVQLLPPWPLVVCVPERDIRPLSERALPVCVRERARSSVSGPLHQTALFSF